MLGIKTKVANAQRLKLFLISGGHFAHGYKPVKSAGSISFPVSGRFEIPKWLDASFGNFAFKEEEAKPKSVFEALYGSIPAKQLDEVKRSFDIIGDIAVLEISGSIAKYAKKIGEAVLAVHHNVKAVLSKSSPMEGEYRVRKFSHVAGEKRTETLYVENGARMKIDLARMYFSPRLATERMRIARQVKPGENYLVLFAGCGPFALVAGRFCRGAKITGVELNPVACEYFERNIRLNKLSNVRCVHADVRRLGGEYLGAYDRIAMPLPKDAELFLPEAISFAKIGAMIHLYSFSEIESGFEKPLAAIGKACADAGRKFEIINKRVVRPFSPHVQQVVIDFRVF
ncbi:MAG: class I SAM-dependent methyltransferase family protein [Candidatus Micrarchaeia archaeon]